MPSSRLVSSVHFKNYTFILIDHHVVELSAVKLGKTPEIDLDLDFEVSFHALHRFASTDLDRNNVFLRFQHLSDIKTLVERFLRERLSGLSGRNPPMI